jgi:hypothetical protein
VTLDDKTGLANAIVTPDVFQQQWVRLRRATTLKIGGPLQKVDGVFMCGPEVRRAAVAEARAGEQRFQVIGYSLPRTVSGARLREVEGWGNIWDRIF